MQTLRATVILIVFFVVTLPLMAVQALLLILRLPPAKLLPHWYHRFVCRLLGLRVHVEGRVARDRPVLIAANHISWLDIPVLSSIAPISFVAKKEVREWPFVGWLARLQRTVFIDRNRRADVLAKANEISGRLREGDRVILFAEGTSSDGNQVLPFRTSLFSAAESRSDGQDGHYIQTLAIVYTHVHGLPMNRQQRPAVAWYGDMDMMGHAWGVLKRGPLDVRIKVSEPVAMTSVGDRKCLAAYAERQVRSDFARLLTARPRQGG